MKLVWIICSNLCTFVKTQKVIAFFIISTIFLTSFSTMLLLRFSWANYQNDLYLSNLLYNYNSITWKFDVTAQQKQLFLEEAIWMEDMPPIKKIDSGQVILLSEQELQKLWKKNGNSDLLSLCDDSIVLNTEEAKNKNIKVNDTYAYENHKYIVSGIWDLENTFLISKNSLSFVNGDMISITYEKTLNQEQNIKLSNLISKYDDIEETSLLFDRQKNMLHDFIRNVCGCIGIGIIGGTNTLFLVWFWNKYNKKIYKVYCLCGGNKGYIICIQLFQMLFLVFIGWIISYLVYYLTVPLQNILLVNYEVRSLLPSSMLFGIGIGLLFLHTVLFIPLYTWQED